MDILSLQFATALAAIIVIDLVLAGDNAIVIALAARNLPKHLQRRAIVWGTVGAIVVRTAMTVIVVQLLKIPGLLLAGGLMLLWIAYKLLRSGTGDGDAHAVQGADSLWAALRTVVIADAVMGLDNVLAVAGAAHGSILLVALSPHTQDSDVSNRVPLAMKSLADDSSHMIANAEGKVLVFAYPQDTVEASDLAVNPTVRQDATDRLRDVMKRLGISWDTPPES